MPAAVRLAREEAFAASLVPSIAMVPTWTRPAARHSTRTWVNSSANTARCRVRNAAMVSWSGCWLAVITRNATSCSQLRSIWRDEVCPTAYP